jgi:trans-aconitate methyltransferase|tara:strand:- start:5992 stop:6606 length:615 start_codon:yes stop_codon:yes gene_type:complete
MKMNPIEVFSEWVKNGKDDGMEKNHLKPVQNMLKFALKDLESFSFIDAGCGTGWVVRMVSKMESCISSVGVDGSINMINKSKRLDPLNEYHCSDLLTWKPQNKKDIVHSMEVLYYFKNPLLVIQNFYNNWINENGRLIIGVDFYYENTSSHDWPEKTNVSTMTLLSESQWEKIFLDSGFKNVKYWRTGKKDGWNGTLVVTGTKN